MKGSSHLPWLYDKPKYRKQVQRPSGKGETLRVRTMLNSDLYMISDELGNQQLGCLSGRWESTEKDVSCPRSYGCFVLKLTGGCGRMSGGLILAMDTQRKLKVYTLSG